MYCFWKIEGVNVLEHNNVIMVKPALIKKLALKEIFKEIAKEVTNKTIKTISFGNFLIVGAAGLAREKLVDAVADILELNPNALEVASKVISNVEDMVMGAVDVVDDIPVVRDMARGVLEGFKTVGKATSYPVNVFKEVIKNVSNTNNYKKIENPLILDFAEVENIIIENIIIRAPLAAAEGGCYSDCKYSQRY
ncbi:conserved hypothetical protein [Candidatus Phytoplasma solani]|nr:conserved hypothetical protein [Candidatus Phytoplasma solani]